MAATDNAEKVLEYIRLHGPSKGRQIADALAPAKSRRFGELRQITDSGIYNAAVMVMADRSPFTVGLERELTDLRTVGDAAITRSSLGTLLGAPGARTSIDGPLLEPAPLNAEQRTAVRQALGEPLTVVTGPPGTGKSQVVTAILVNAAWRGLRVLFASKNNKAVDVVMERVNALSPRPIMLRLGTRALQEQLALHLTAILSARPTDDDRRAYESMLVKLRADGEALDRLAIQTNHLVMLRNTVDELERAAERARKFYPSPRLVMPTNCRLQTLRRNWPTSEKRSADPIARRLRSLKSSFGHFWGNHDNAI